MKTPRLISLATLVTATLVLAPSTDNASGKPLTVDEQYLGDVAPLNVAVTKWIAETNGWTSSVTSAQVKAQDAPFIAALHAFQGRLLHQLWPTVSARKVATLYTSVTFLEGILSTLNTMSGASATSYLSEAQGQDSITASNANPVRSSLSLPALAGPNGRKLNYKY
jgi:hypothetical protein